MRIRPTVSSLLIVVAVVLGACGTPAVTTTADPSVAETATETQSASPTESVPAATPDAPTAPADLQFKPTLFGRSEGQARVNALTPHSNGLVAVGVEYEHHLPIVGPTPAHEGRVWSSADGHTWDDVTPRGLFGNVVLHTLIRRADGMLLALGTTSTLNQYGDLGVIGFGAWESPDGRAWTAAQTGLPDDRWIRSAVQGDKGILANVWQVGATHGTELWFSADGRSWEKVRQLRDGFFGMDAGDEGFVVAGMQGPYGEPFAPFAIASADGREWFEAPSPPDDMVSVAAIGGDWLALSVTPPPASTVSTFATWHSPNGLDWSRAEDIQLGRNSPAGDADCPLGPLLESADRYVVVRSYWSGLCSEGGVHNFGPHQLALDGHDWHDLALVPEGDAGSGAWVAASAVIDGQLILAGESNDQAAFWLGE